MQSRGNIFPQSNIYCTTLMRCITFVAGSCCLLPLLLCFASVNAVHIFCATLTSSVTVCCLWVQPFACILVLVYLMHAFIAFYCMRACLAACRIATTVSSSSSKRKRKSNAHIYANIYTILRTWLSSHSIALFAMEHITAPLCAYYIHEYN